jgi:hypothetical protein
MEIDIESMVEAAVGRHVREMTAQEIADLQLVSIREAAGLLGIGETKARSLIREYVNLGEKTPRVRLSTIRRLIEERTIPA